MMISMLKSLSTAVKIPSTYQILIFENLKYVYFKFCFENNILIKNCAKNSNY